MFFNNHISFTKTSNLDKCSDPFNTWRNVVDTIAVLVLLILNRVDGRLAAKMGLNCGSQQRNVFFHRRMVVLSIRCLLLYPLLWVLTINRTMWFIKERHSSDGPPLIILWLLLNFTILCCNPCLWVRKWLARRKAHLRAHPGIPISEYRVLVDMIREPDWESEAAGLTRSSLIHTAATNLAVVYLTADEGRQVTFELAKIRLEAVPTYCTACPICLEEFRVGNEVCGIHGVHYLHAKCIHYLVPGNASCPWCGRSVFPMIDLSAMNHLDTGAEQEQQQPSVGAQQRYSRFLRSLVV